MPTINGIKMACAPCIRGHRSTKCNHADERLMVPVRKPGRPLSVCPHPQDQPCSCGSVTAAIPRKQQCGCGGSSYHDGHVGKPSNIHAAPVIMQTKPIPSLVAAETPKIPAGPPPIMKTTSTSSKIQKSSRPPMAGRKQSYDMVKSEKIRSEEGNIVDFKAKRIHTNPKPLAPTLEHPSYIGEKESLPRSLAGPKPDTSVEQLVNRHSDFKSITPSMNAISHPFNSGPITPPIDVESKFAQFGVVSPPQQFQGYTRQLHQQPNGVIIETRIHNVGPNGVANINGNWLPQYKKETIATTQQPTQSQPSNAGERSCCSTKRKHVPEESPKPVEASNRGSCCSSKRSKSRSNSTTQSTPSQSPHLPTMKNPNSQINHVTGSFQAPDFLGQLGGFEYMPQSGLIGLAHPSVFAYPPAYGSYQHPLQPAQWRQGVQYNTYAQLMSANLASPTQGQILGAMEDGLDTLHTCGCGDGCECIGCAAHPYNEATQNYVRSAWEIGMEQPAHHRGASQNSGITENYSISDSTALALDTNGNNVNEFNTQSNGASGPQISPPAGTPSDTTADDPPLSASDFFFVNYPFDGCGGDTQSCPCGDDCACLGCSIHNNSDSPPMPDSKLNADDEIPAGAPNDDQSPNATGSCCGGTTAENGHANDNNFDESGPLDASFGEMCAGDESTCPCPPDGCHCIGCTIHARA